MAAVPTLNDIRNTLHLGVAHALQRFQRFGVGLNAYTDNDEKRPIDILQIPATVETEQVARLKAFKARRDPKAVAKALENIRAACRGTAFTPVNDLGLDVAKSGLHATNVMPALVDGALSNCTLGEMVQAMADIYGRYNGGPEW